MRKIKEVLRLKFEVGLANRQIARSCAINHSTVADYLRRAQASGLGCWPLPLDDTELETRLFPARPAMGAARQQRPAPNWSVLNEQLRTDKHVTLQLLWQEYKQSTSGRLSVQPILRALSTMGWQAGSGFATGTPRR